MSNTATTSSHEKIKEWVQAHHGKPAQVADSPGLLRIRFQDEDNDLEVIEWDQFFKTFDENNLSFLHSEDDNSTFCKFVN